MINFTQAFESAWERMHIILFRPFDFGKWCTIGLSAFLAGLLQGGNGFNSSFNPNANYKAFTKPGGTQAPTINIQQFNTNFSHAISGMQVGLIVVIVLMTFLFIIGFILLLYWLGARGQFLFMDNIVRNRGEIAWPWRTYARQANSLFLFFLLLFAITMAVLIVLGGIAAIIGVPLFQQHRWANAGEITIFVVLGFVYLVFCVFFGFFVFVFREFGVPLMFRHGLTALPAFRESVNLVKLHPGSVIVFVLLRIAIFIGVAILSIIVCCATCCIAALPYIGTVILLPVLIFVKCFTLDCLAQFGPQYNVWTVDVPPPAPESQLPR
jgi:hypothetical protein